MRVIYQPRKTSRTSTLIDLCWEAEQRGELAYMVCHSHPAAYAVKQRADEMGKNIRFPLTFDELMTGRGNMAGFGGKELRLFIDNCDDFLHGLVRGATIEAVVFEKEPEELMPGNFWEAHAG